MTINQKGPAATMTQDRRRQIRREMDLDRDELFFLLESYRNMIELNTTLLERQEVINHGIERIIAETAKICASQSAIAATIGKLPEALRDLINALCAASVDTMQEVKKEIQSNRQAENDEHHAHTLRIYAAYGLSITAILALISLIAKVWPSI